MEKKKLKNIKCPLCGKSDEILYIKYDKYSRLFLCNSCQFELDFQSKFYATVKKFICPSKVDGLNGW